ncbi:MAG: hypothetical protein ACOY45_04870 [Pseudomonadota bacterium]
MLIATFAQAQAACATGEAGKSRVTPMHATQVPGTSPCGDCGDCAKRDCGMICCAIPSMRVPGVARFSFAPTVTLPPLVSRLLSHASGVDPPPPRRAEALI